MADTVDVIKVFQGTKRLELLLLNTSDGTGETDVTKLNLSTFVGNNGVVPTYFTLDEVEYNVNNMEVSLQINGTTPADLLRLGNGSNRMSFRDVGGLTVKNTGTGASNLILTTIGAQAGSSYAIKLFLRFKP